MPESANSAASPPFPNPPAGPTGLSAPPDIQQLLKKWFWEHLTGAGSSDQISRGMIPLGPGALRATANPVAMDMQTLMKIQHGQELGGPLTSLARQGARGQAVLKGFLEKADLAQGGAERFLQNDVAVSPMTGSLAEAEGMAGHGLAGIPLYRGVAQSVEGPLSEPSNNLLRLLMNMGLSLTTRN